MACYGGIATCTERAECTVCGNLYGEINRYNHNAATEWSSDATHHWKECKRCGEDLNKAVHGGEATCVAAATCPTCNKTHGSVNPNAHAPATEWTGENGKHWKACANTGCTVHLDEANCSGGTATCTEKAECSVCGNEYGVVNPNAHAPATEWTGENGKHWKACANTGCTVHLDEANCSGGTATCTEKAECAVCGNVYGELAAHVYGSDFKSDASNHWNECACGAKANTGDHADSDENGKCDACDYQIGDSKGELGTGAVVGISVGSALAVEAIGFGVYALISKKKKLI